MRWLRPLLSSRFRCADSGLLGFHTVRFDTGAEETATATTRDSQLQCPPGRYCLPDGISYPCPAGRYGGSYGLDSSNCSGPCAPGFWCPLNSTSENERICGGEHLYCPLGSVYPLAVDIGYYSTQGPPLARANQSICTPGSYCEAGVKRFCPAGSYGNIEGMVEGCEAACPDGHYCEIGSTRPVPCPAGRFGNTGNLTTAHCDGPCEAGYYCESGSSSSTQFECGAEDYVCPVGSSAPTLRTVVSECDPDASLYGACPSQAISQGHTSYSYGDKRFDPYVVPWEEE